MDSSPDPPAWVLGVNDLPGSTRRLRQTATGFKATIVNGQVLMYEGQAAGVTPAGCSEALSPAFDMCGSTAIKVSG